MFYLLEFHEWTEAAIEESVLQKEVFFNTVVVKGLNFIKVADL